jgi:glycosyltransferase involved in cell wall biosynthesis
MPWLSVLMPTYNGERWIGEALQSVAAAAEDDGGLECVIIDGGSTDGTLRIVERFAARLPLRLFVRPDLPRWVEKTNFAFEVAESDYVCMLHNDDFWLPGRTAAVKDALSKNPDAVMVVHDTRFVDAEGRSLGVWRCRLPPCSSSSELTGRLLVQNFIAVPSPTFRRSDALRVGGIDSTLWYTGDWDFYLKLAALGRTVYIERVLAAFRVHQHSLSVSGSRDDADFRAQLAVVVDHHAARLPASSRDQIVALARASNAINAALASALHGRPSALPAAVFGLVRLGPLGWKRFLHDTRLHERTAARLRALIAGSLVGWRRG